MGGKATFRESLSMESKSRKASESHKYNLIRIVINIYVATFSEVVNR